MHGILSLHGPIGWPGGDPSVCRRGLRLVRRQEGVHKRAQRLVSSDARDKLLRHSIRLQPSAAAARARLQHSVNVAHSQDVPSVPTARAVRRVHGGSRPLRCERGRRAVRHAVDEDERGAQKRARLGGREQPSCADCPSRPRLQCTSSAMATQRLAYHRKHMPRHGARNARLNGCSGSMRVRARMCVCAMPAATRRSRSAAAASPRPPRG